MLSKTMKSSDEIASRDISDLEEDTVLLLSDLGRVVLWRDGFDERGSVEVSGKIQGKSKSTYK
jgi:hypothetical protein